MAEPNPSEVAPWYLRNITQALALDETTGNVYVRTGFEGNIIISGNVNIPGNVDAHVSEIGTSGELTVPWMPVSIDGNSNVTISGGNVNATVTGTVTAILSGNLAGITGNVTVVDGGGSLTVDGNVGITGNVNIGTMPNVNASISGNVGISSFGNIPISGNTLPVSGNVNIGTMPEVEIKNDTGNPIPVSKDTNTNSVTNPIYVEGVNNASFFAPTQSDAFGRLRVSNPLTLFDTQNKYADQGQFVSNLVSGGTCTYNQNSNTFLLSVSGSGSSVVRETTKTFVYQPGKSLFVLNTFAMNTPTLGVTQRVGYYNTNNGIFFEANGTTLNMVIRSYSSGSIVETRIPQSNWNGDTMTGLGGSTNPSGIALNPALAQIFWTDIEWLGVGSVRTGFVINGQYIVCHTFNHANIPGNTTTYMGTAVLPVRHEISTTGTAASMRQICSTVISEGGYSPTGTPAGRGHELATPVRLPNDQSFKPVMAIRLKSTQSDAVVIPVDFTLVPKDQALIKYKIYGQAITSGGTWVDQGATSSVQYNLAPTALVSGEHTVSGFIVSNNQSINAPQGTGFDFTEQLSRNPFTGTMYEYLIMAATTGTNIDVYAAINWQEVT